MQNIPGSYCAALLKNDPLAAIYNDVDQKLIVKNDSGLKGSPPATDHFLFSNLLDINSMKLVIPLLSLYWSIHTKDESKRGTAFAFIFGVN